MVKSAEFIAGYQAATDDLAREGDYRGVDWSAPHQYLRERRTAMIPAVYQPALHAEYEYTRLFIGHDMITLNEIGKEGWALCHMHNGYGVFGRKRTGP
jgi:hypothetical protein